MDLQRAGGVTDETQERKQVRKEGVSAWTRSEREEEEDGRGQMQLRESDKEERDGGRRMR